MDFSATNDERRNWSKTFKVLEEKLLDIYRTMEENSSTQEERAIWNVSLLQNRIYGMSQLVEYSESKRVSTICKVDQIVTVVHRDYT